MSSINTFRSIILSLIFLFGTKLSAQNFHWMKSVGGKAGDGGGTIVKDYLGNIVTFGFFNDTADFDPGPGIVNLVTTNGYGGDPYILKLDSAGNYLWVKTIGSPGLNGLISVSQMALDAQGNIYLTGGYIGGVDFDPGPGTVNPPGLPSKYTMFILKLNSVGDFVWVRTMGGVESYGSSSCLTLDTKGNIIYAGAHRQDNGGVTPFTPLLDFDPGPGVYTLTIPAFQNWMPFVSKLDSSGNFLWVKSYNANWWGAGGKCNSAISDSTDNIYLTGNFSGTVDFDPGVGSYSLSSSGLNDAFVMKLNNNGDLVWVKQVGGTNEDYGFDIELDSRENVLTTGVYWGNGDFDPGPGSDILTSNGDADVYVSKLDNNGNHMWAKSFGGPQQEYCQTLTCDKYNNVYTAGGFSSTVDFDPGPGISNLTCTGFWDMFISKLDSSGNYCWSKCTNGQDSISFSYPSSILADEVGSVLISGQYYPAVDFNPDYGVFIPLSKGDREAFILKLGPCNASLTINSPSILCAGSSIKISATGAVNYTWSPGGYLTSTLIVNPSIMTVYSVTGALASDCIVFGTTTVTVVPLPISVLNSTNSSCPDNCTGKVNASTTGGMAPYTYSLANIGNISPPYTSLCMGLYTLYTIDAHGCSNFNIFSIECSEALSISDNSNSERLLKVFPNPTNDYVIVELDNNTFDCLLYNSLGQLLTSHINVYGKASISLKDLPKGIYVLEVFSENEGFQRKLVVE